jgi:hypothetical protein
LVLSQDIHWNAFRLGLSTEWKITDRLRFSTEVAWLPIVALNGTDTHALRFLITPQDGGDALSSVQLEAALNYYFPNGFSVGIGARYWHLQIGAGAANWPISGSPQAAAIKVERLGAFLQTSYKFGELLPSGASRP